MRPLPTARAVAGAALATALLAALACRRGPTLEVGPARVSQGPLLAPLRETGLDEAAIAAAADGALASAGFRSGKGERALRARIDVIGVRIAPASGGAGPRAEVAVELELTSAEPGGRRRAREEGVGAAPLLGEKPADAFGRALQRAAGEAAGEVALALAAADKPVEKLIADLSSGEPRRRAQAARALAERGDPQAVPALLERLEDPDPDVVQRAVGALALLKDPRAVGPLIELSRKGDERQGVTLLRIIGDLGGPEARGYLLTVEAGHPDLDVQQAAREALAEMDAREREAAPAAVAR